MHIHLGSLNSGMTGLTSAAGMMLAEAAAVCFEDRSHKSGDAVFVEGDATGQCAISWNTVDDQQRRSNKDMQDATEFGACAVAILLVRETTGLEVVERSVKGGGFDYYIGQPGDEGLFTENQSRLEVSGLLNSSDSDYKSRIKAKKLQIQKSTGGDAYVAVVDFAKPRVHMSKS